MAATFSWTCDTAAKLMVPCRHLGERSLDLPPTPRSASTIRQLRSVKNVPERIGALNRLSSRLGGVGAAASRPALRALSTTLARSYLPNGPLRSMGCRPNSKDCWRGTSNRDGRECFEATT